MARGGRRVTDKVACPNCGCLNSRVKPSRQTVEQQQTDGYWRLRECMICHKHYETEERVTAAVDLPRCKRTPPKTQAF
jgi:transcriptional regulator NrdR family protein